MITAGAAADMWLKCGRRVWSSRGPARDSKPRRGTNPTELISAAIRQAAQQSPASFRGDHDAPGTIRHQILNTQAACPHRARAPLWAALVILVGTITLSAAASGLSA